MDTSIDRRIFFLINRSRHVLLKWADTVLMEELSVTSAQLAALFVLQKEDGCLLKELSRALGLNNSAITGLVSRMQRAGLVDKRSCNEDGRASRAYITPRGAATATASIPFIDQFNGAVTEGFSDDEMETVCRFLGSVIERVSHIEKFSA